LGISRTDHATPLYKQKLVLTSPTRGGRSVGIVLSQTKAMDLVGGLFNDSVSTSYYVMKILSVGKVDENGNKVLSIWIVSIVLSFI
jgi:hypothetical protein